MRSGPQSEHRSMHWDRLPEASFQFLLANEAQIGAQANSTFDRHAEIDDLDLVLNERPASFTVLPAQFRVGERNAIAVAQQPCTAIGKRVDHRRGAGREAVELGAWTIDVAGMKEPQQPVIRAIERAAD
jgi:hypothetical protein